MRWNEDSLAALAHTQPEWEGKLRYKAPKSGATSNLTALSSAVLGAATSASTAALNDLADYKERWFRLRANCLFFWKERPSVNNKPEPAGVLILEGSHAQPEGFEVSGPKGSAFSVIYASDPERRHLFVADNARSASQWVSALHKGRYGALRERLMSLQIQLRTKTGVDPLRGTNLENNYYFRNQNSSFEDLSEIGLENSSSSGNPTPKPRRSHKATRAAPPPPGLSSTLEVTGKHNPSFQSHIVESWEKINSSAHGGAAASTSSRDASRTPEMGRSERKLSKPRDPSFKSHVKEGQLIDFN